MQACLASQVGRMPSGSNQDRPTWSTGQRGHCRACLITESQALGYERERFCSSSRLGFCGEFRRMVVEIEREGNV